MPTTQLLLYDADCGFCTRCAQWLGRAAPARGYRIAPWQETDLDSLGLTPQQCDEAAWFIAADGTRHRGSAAIAQALLHGSAALRPLGVLLTFPGVRWLAALGYGWVARFRHRLPGGTPRCRLR
ncbi:MAG: DUF393 domain-containing protein [Propionibacteriaceae bacterium]|nr:DUF393 domain-containing protein [Propionibacteriaceae bacterium]